MTSLSIHDLKQADIEKRNRHHELYKELLLEVNEKIKKRNKENFKNMTYDIPIFKYGHPTINVCNAMQYIIMKLNKGGFVAYPYGDSRRLYIDWSVNIKPIQVEKKATMKKEDTEIPNDILDKRIQEIRKKA